MKNESARWFEFARTNLNASHCLLKNGYYNPCLQEAQQAIEKAMKALLIEKGVAFQKTHSVFVLRESLTKINIDIALDDADCAFIDSIYLPSKYPLGNLLPDGDPSEVQCRKCLEIADRVCGLVDELLGILKEGER